MQMGDHMGREDIEAIETNPGIFSYEKFMTLTDIQGYPFSNNIEI
jgi:hypothetical protein